MPLPLLCSDGVDAALLVRAELSSFVCKVLSDFELMLQQTKVGYVTRDLHYIEYITENMKDLCNEFQNSGEKRIKQFPK